MCANPDHWVEIRVEIDGDGRTTEAPFDPNDLAHLCLALEEYINNLVTDSNKIIWISLGPFCKNCQGITSDSVEAAVNLENLRMDPHERGLVDFFSHLKDRIHEGLMVGGHIDMPYISANN